MNSVEKPHIRLTIHECESCAKETVHELHKTHGMDVEICRKCNNVKRLEGAPV